MSDVISPGFSFRHLQNGGNNYTNFRANSGSMELTYTYKTLEESLV